MNLAEILLSSSLGELLRGALNLVGVELENILLEVLGTEREGVASVDNLYDEIGALEGTPKLAPDLEVTFEGGEEERLVVLEAVEARNGQYW